ncbi:DUF6012 family protein [Pseudomonas aeruginosa]
MLALRLKASDLHGLGGRDGVARLPLPDKRYPVACRKSVC